MRAHLLKFISILFFTSLTNCHSNENYEKIDFDNVLPTGTCQFNFRELTFEERLQHCQKFGAKVQAIYKFEANGFPKGERYKFFSVNLKQQVTLLAKYVVDEFGKPISKENPDLDLNKVVIRNDGFANGEPVLYVLVGENGLKKASICIIPNPIQAKWNDGAFISIEAASTTLDQFYIEGLNFRSNEKILFSYFVDDEIVTGEMHANEKGQCVTVINPVRKKSSKGRCKVKIKRSCTKEEKIFQFFFGEEAFEAIKN